MARCPYAPHRLVVTIGGSCRRCNEDVRLYAALQAVPVLLFNDARRMWDEKNMEGAAALLARAVELRPGFQEAHWLLAAVESARGRGELARMHLVRAGELGAETDLGWLNPSVATEPAPPAALDPEPAESEPESTNALETTVEDDEPVAPLGPDTLLSDVGRAWRALSRGRKAGQPTAKPAQAPANLPGAES
jgi:hypothetical protein